MRLRCFVVLRRGNVAVIKDSCTPYAIDKKASEYTCINPESSSIHVREHQPPKPQRAGILIYSTSLMLLKTCLGTTKYLTLVLMVGYVVSRESDEEPANGSWDHPSSGPWTKISRVRPYGKGCRFEFFYSVTEYFTCTV